MTDLQQKLNNHLRSQLFTDEAVFDAWNAYVDEAVSDKDNIEELRRLAIVFLITIAENCFHKHVKEVIKIELSDTFER